MVPRGVDVQPEGLGLGPRLFLVWLVPAVWVACSLLSYLNPGRGRDSYGLYAVSSLAGSWVVAFMGRGDIHSLSVPAVIAVVGGGVMALAGFILDRVGVARKPWAVGLAVAVVVAFLALQTGYPAAARAPARGATWAGILFYSINTGLCLTVLGAFVVVMVGRFLNRDRR